VFTVLLYGFSEVLKTKKLADKIVFVLLLLPAKKLHLTFDEIKKNWLGNRLFYRIELR